jgi:hypothetical protein
MLLWSSDLDLEIKNFSQRQINAVINSSDLGFS